jgi:hypothetical protein
MLLVGVTCSDPECAEEREVALGELDELDEYPCDCGYGSVVVRVSELDEPTRSVSLVSLPDRRRASTRKAA